jgi:hypothetical protein
MLVPSEDSIMHRERLASDQASVRLEVAIGFGMAFRLRYG